MIFLNMVYTYTIGFNKYFGYDTIFTLNQFLVQMYDFVVLTIVPLIERQSVDHICYNRHSIAIATHSRENIYQSSEEQRGELSSNSSSIYRLNLCQVRSKTFSGYSGHKIILDIFYYMNIKNFKWVISKAIVYINCT